VAGGNRPIEFTFVADVAKYLREVKKMEVSTEDIQDALVGVTNSADDLERKLSKAMRDAAKDTEVLERAVKDLPKATETAADESRKDFGRMGESAKEAGQEVGDEFKSNLSESLSSGDFTELITGTLGGLVGGLSGPIGAAAAGGIAIATALWQSFKGQSDKMKETMETQLGFVDLLTGELDKVAKVEAGLAELGGGNLSQGIQDATKYANDLGLEYGDIVDLVSGDLTPANDRLYKLLQQQNEENDTSIDNYNDHKVALWEVLKTATLNRDAAKVTAENIAHQRDYMIETGLATDPQVQRMQAIAAAAKDIPENIRVKLDFYSTDPIGQSLISRNSANFSPGHVAIANMYAGKAGLSS
jgi:hypothetical protein